MSRNVLYHYSGDQNMLLLLATPRENLLLYFSVFHDAIPLRNFLISCTWEKELKEGGKCAGIHHSFLAVGRDEDVEIMGWSQRLTLPYCPDPLLLGRPGFKGFTILTAVSPAGDQASEPVGDMRPVIPFLLSSDGLPSVHMASPASQD